MVVNGGIADAFSESREGGIELDAWKRRIGGLFRRNDKGGAAMIADAFFVDEEGADFVVGGLFGRPDFCMGYDLCFFDAAAAATFDGAGQDGALDEVSVGIEEVTA